MIVARTATPKTEDRTQWSTTSLWEPGRLRLVAEHETRPWVPWVGGIGTRWFVLLLFVSGGGIRAKAIEYKVLGISRR